MRQTKAISTSTLRHLGWMELLEHYRGCLRTRIAQERISLDLAALQEEASEVSKRYRRELSLDPEPRQDEGKQGGAKDRLAQLRGLEGILERESEASHKGNKELRKARLFVALSDIEDVEASLKKLEGSGALTLVELLEVEALLSAAEIYVSLNGDPKGSLASLDTYLWGGKGLSSERVEECFRLGRALARSICWEDGATEPKLADAASPALKNLRIRLRKQKQQLMQDAERLVKHETVGDMLQNRYWTEREGRVVLPMRSDALGKLALEDFVVHGASATGQTVYVEPKDLVVGNNGFRQAEMHVLVEEQRIIQEFCRSISGIATELRVLQRAMLRLDDVAARLDLSNKMGGIEPEILDLDRELEDKIDLNIDAPGLKHPLMVLRGLDVIPNDIRVPVASALIISGPNAGGKTVALKATGLAILLAKCGVRVPSSATARLPDYHSIVTDVGDGQSIAANLSTFSAQMMHVKDAWSAVQKRNKKSLILFDEIAVGTDPEQGAALAEAIVVELLQCSATVMVTTHYDRLKHLANSKELGLRQPVQNAAVGFDLENMRPTFRLSMGLPGTSSPINVARRLGVCEEILQRAEGKLDGRSREIDRLLLELAAEKDRVYQRSVEVQAETRALEQRERKIEERERKMLDRSITKQQQALEEASRELSVLTQELKTERKRIRKAGIDPDTVLDSKSILSGPQQRLAKFRQEETPPSIDSAPSTSTKRDLEIGMKVKVRGFSEEGELVAMKSGRAMVQFLNLRTTVSVREIESGSDEFEGQTSKGKNSRSKRVDRESSSKRQNFSSVDRKKNRESSVLASSTAHRHFTSDPIAVAVGVDNSIDLRGTRAEQVSEQLEIGLDRAMRRDQDVVVLIHGYGSGSLRKMLRQHLKRLDYVRKYRPGIAAEGADGVTIVWLGGE